MDAEFKTSANAYVGYRRLGNIVKVVCEGYWFDKNEWAEVTAELFPSVNMRDKFVDQEIGEFVDQEIGE